MRINLTIIIFSVLASFIMPRSIQAEELVVIQGVSKSLKSFMIRRGRKDGISMGQKSLFSTEKVSLIAYAAEVSRQFSVWQVSDENATIPFTKSQFVNFNFSINSVWSEIPKLEAKLAAKKELQKILKESKCWVLRGAYSMALTEAVSESTQQAKRQGKQFSFSFYNPINYNLNWEFGLRYDEDMAKLRDPEGSSIPTIRYMLVGAINYKFANQKKEENYFYLGAGAGAGFSNTTINTEKTSGWALVLPEVHLGFNIQQSKKFSFLIETVAEAIASKETFASGVAQTTNILNIKLAAGVRF